MKIKLEKKAMFLLMLLLFPYFKPVGIVWYPTLNRIFQISKAFSLCISIVIIVCQIKQKYFLKKKYFGLLGLVVFEGIYIVNTLFYGNESGDIINNSVTNIILVILIVTISNSKYKKDFIFAINMLFSIELVGHILSVVLAECGLSLFGVYDAAGNTYLFGRDNYSAFFVLPMLGVMVYTDKLLLNKRFASIKDNIICTMLFLCYLYTNSATAIIAMFLMIVLMNGHLLWKEILKIITIRKIIILITLFLVGVIFFNIQNHFAALLSFAFNKGAKGITLNSRTIIWSFALDLIGQKPLLGWGNLSNEQILNYALYGTEHAHNIILEILLRTGGVGLISYVWFSVSPSKKLEKILESKAYYLLVTQVCFWGLSIMDWYPLIQAQYCMMGLLYCWQEYESCDCLRGMKKLIWKCRKR